MKMNKSISHILYWSPRILAILSIIFFSIFALDVFAQPQWFLALLMHLIPSFAFAILTVIAWKRENIGGFLFLAASLISTVFFHSLIIAIPAAIIGVLFLMSVLL